MNVKHAVFASVGPPMADLKDPVKSTVFEYNPRIIYLVGSDEDPLPDRGSTRDNIEVLTKRYAEVNVEVEPMLVLPNTISDAILSVSSLMIQELQDFPKIPLILDLSAGRLEMSYILSQAGHLTLEFLSEHGNNLPEDQLLNLIQCHIRSKEYPIVKFNLKTPFHPDQKSIKLMRKLPSDYTLENLGKLVELSHSQVSRNFAKLKRYGYIEIKGRKRKLTTLGRKYLDFYERNK